MRKNEIVKRLEDDIAKAVGIREKQNIRISELQRMLTLINANVNQSGEPQNET